MDGGSIPPSSTPLAQVSATSGACWSRNGHGSPARARPSASAAARSSWAVTCWYTRIVTATSACPRRWDTSFTGTPARSMTVVAVCRASCSRIAGSPARATASGHQRVIVSGAAARRARPRGRDRNRSTRRQRPTAPLPDLAARSTARGPSPGRARPPWHRLSSSARRSRPRRRRHECSRPRVRRQRDRRPSSGARTALHAGARWRGRAATVGRAGPRPPTRGTPPLRTRSTPSSHAADVVGAARPPMDFVG